jgi:hypothetical protein
VTAPATLVRAVQRGESVRALVEETKALAWVANAEHAVIKLVTGGRIIVRGGPTGIQFSRNSAATKVFVTISGLLNEVERIYWHTHPRVTGPSDDDLRVLEILHQSRSYLFEIGGESQGTVIRPK